LLSISDCEWSWQTRHVKVAVDVWWHVLQLWRCGPDVIGNRWLNVAWFHEVSVARWQLSHVVGNPDEACGGLLVRLYWSW